MGCGEFLVSTSPGPALPPPHPTPLIPVLSCSGWFQRMASGVLICLPLPALSPTSPPHTGSISQDSGPLYLACWRLSPQGLVGRHLALAQVQVRRLRGWGGWGGGGGGGWGGKFVGFFLDSVHHPHFLSTLLLPDLTLTISTPPSLTPAAGPALWCIVLGARPFRGDNRPTDHQPWGVR